MKPIREVMSSSEDAQRAICLRFGVEPVGVPDELKVGISSNVLQGLMPLNGMRCKPVGDTTGWYIWAGEELSDDPNFFAPLHISHLPSWCESVIPYLQLPPGWRFLLAPGYEDVWYDEGLLEVGGT
jgi:hypothetical protein